MNASDLTVFQRCPRRWRIENSIKPTHRWIPKLLFNHVIAPAIQKIMCGENAASSAAEARTLYIEAASEPGLECSNPHETAVDYLSIISTVCEAVARLPRVPCAPGFPVRLGSETWLINAYKATDGQSLHRWEAVERAGAGTVSALLHSWRVFGDVAALALPMVVHLIEIGARRNGRQHTPWCRAFRHPAIMGRFAFQQRDGSKLKGEWNPVWFDDSDQQDPVKWVDLMEHDGVNLIKEIRVAAPSPQQRQEFIAQVCSEAKRMSETPQEWRDVPMFRPACDIPVVCPYQEICYGRER